ncbi:hypothetical protein DM02DRAFT_611797 [Periconia macrospinosa]|uniref:Uncharacterized protein n=1 Tax=Periconia macrospinosa TaxID=97972 RepID=A0A2V1E2U7_9PLEO|nr:hypothetical protein DM02DRAFT_611797 [Periconia macrospinosa]
MVSFEQHIILSPTTKLYIGTLILCLVLLAGSIVFLGLTYRSINNKENSNNSNTTLGDAGAGGNVVVDDDGSEKKKEGEDDNKYGRSNGEEKM